MKRGNVLALTCVALATLLCATATIPNLRLKAERESAEREGLALTFDDLRNLPPIAAAQNANNRLGEALGLFQRTNLGLSRASRAVIAGSDTPADRKTVSSSKLRLEPSFAACRAAMAYPALRFDGNFVPTSFTGEQWLTLAEDMIAAAVISPAPKNDLQAVAHLSALLRQDPSIQNQAVGLKIGRECLQVALRHHLGREIEPLLGPPTNIRFLVRPLLPFLLDKIQQREHRIDNMSIADRLERGFLFENQQEARAIHAWRNLWKGLDGNDYFRAASLMDRKLPPIDALGTEIPLGFCFRCLLQERMPNAGKLLRDFAAFEAMRSRARIE